MRTRLRRLDNGSIAQASDLVKALFHHPQNENRYKRIKVLEAETGYNLGDIVLGYLLGQPFPVFPIVGPKKGRPRDVQRRIRAGARPYRRQRLLKHFCRFVLSAKNA
jgi:hypothetical protein